MDTEKCLLIMMELSDISSKYREVQGLHNDITSVFRKVFECMPAEDADKLKKHFTNMDLD